VVFTLLRLPVETKDLIPTEEMVESLDESLYLLHKEVSTRQQEEEELRVLFK